MAKAEMIFLRRTAISRATGSKMEGLFLFEMAKRDKPYIGQPFMDEHGNEYWNVEKQFWLKYKEHFQGLGFLPFDNYNEVKKIPFMLEKY